MSNARKITEHTFTENDHLLFDANIWVLIYGHLGDPYDRRLRTYSEALMKIIQAKSHLYVDVLVMSEFVNSYSRFKYNLVKKEEPTLEFKAFRNRPEFREVTADIADSARRILGVSDQIARIESGFSTLDTATLLTSYEMGDSDFNDLVLAELCKAKNLTLVTDDGDFTGFDIPILTANNRLLSQ